MVTGTADIPESVYLNAAKKALVARTPALTADEAARLAPLVSGSAEHRAAVESVWAARGEHDAATIQRVRALAEEWRRRADFALFGAVLAEALDAQRPAYGTPEWAARDATIATTTGHTVGCMCYRCEGMRK